MLTRFELKVTAPLLAVSLLLLLIAGLAAWYVHRLQQEASQLLATSIAGAGVAKDLETAIRELRSRLNQYVITGAPEHIDAVAGIHDEARHCLVTTERLEITAEGKLLVAELSRGFTVFADGLSKLDRKQPTGTTRKAILELVDDVLSKDLLDRARRHREQREQEVLRASQREKTVTDRVGLILLLLGSCGAVAGLIAGFGIARGVQRSIVELSIPVKNAFGALDEVIGPITVSSAGNIGRLQDELEKLSQRVAAVVQRLQATQRDVLRAEQLAAVGQLAAGLAHEMRNPLTAMKTLVQTARERGGVASLDDRDLDVLEEEITRLNTTIQTFLDYARPPKLARQAVDVRNVVDSTIQLLSARADQQGIRLEVRVPEGLPLVDADPEQLRQVMLNLILNACDAQPTGGMVEIVASVDQVPGHQAPLRRSRMLKVDVKDRGSGLPDEVRERLFDPFVSTKDSGTGLGLSICRRIVEEHGGKITGSNRPDGEGAIFTVRLPLDGPTNPS